MKTRFLFPYSSRIFGYLGIVAYIPIMVLKKILHQGYNNPDPAIRLADATSIFNSEHILGALAGALVIVGLLIIAFSKEKIEDEQIVQLRLDSLQWAIYLNYLILIISIFLVANFQVKYILLLNLWAPLIFFIIRFRWVIYRNNRLPKEDAL